MGTTGPMIASVLEGRVEEVDGQRLQLRLSSSHRMPCDVEDTLRARLRAMRVGDLANVSAMQWASLDIPIGAKHLLEEAFRRLCGRKIGDPATVVEANSRHIAAPEGAVNWPYEENGGMRLVRIHYLLIGVDDRLRDKVQWALAEWEHAVSDADLKVKLEFKEVTLNEIGETARAQIKNPDGSVEAQNATESVEKIKQQLKELSEQEAAAGDDSAASAIFAYIMSLVAAQKTVGSKRPAREELQKVGITPQKLKEIAANPSKVVQEVVDDRPMANFLEAPSTFWEAQHWGDSNFRGIHSCLKNTALSLDHSKSAAPSKPKRSSIKKHVAEDSKMRPPIVDDLLEKLKPLKAQCNARTWREFFQKDFGKLFPAVVESVRRKWICNALRESIVQYKVVAAAGQPLYLNQYFPHKLMVICPMRIGKPSAAVGDKDKTAELDCATLAEEKQFNIEACKYFLSTMIQNVANIPTIQMLLAIDAIEKMMKTAPMTDPLDQKLLTQFLENNPNHLIMGDVSMLNVSKAFKECVGTFMTQYPPDLSNSAGADAQQHEIGVTLGLTYWQNSAGDFRVLVHRRHGTLKRFPLNVPVAAHLAGLYETNSAEWASYVSPDTLVRVEDHPEMILNKSVNDQKQPDPSQVDSYVVRSIMHEIGHALGLDEGFKVNFRDHQQQGAFKVFNLDVPESSRPQLTGHVDFGSIMMYDPIASPLVDVVDKLFDEYATCLSRSCLPSKWDAIFVRQLLFGRADTKDPPMEASDKSCKYAMPEDIKRKEKDPQKKFHRYGDEVRVKVSDIAMKVKEDPKAEVLKGLYDNLEDNYDSMDKEKESESDDDGTGPDKKPMEPPAVNMKQCEENARIIMNALKIALKEIQQLQNSIHSMIGVLNRKGSVTGSPEEFNRHLKNYLHVWAASFMLLIGIANFLQKKEMLPFNEFAIGY
eukprot:CAMPEP_0177684708 /NCGR_PEP_ID=MMETSP0447-20121125/32579_1 /TAXON_ID=0 /ORGANISM="Stygamoeba regulata, Strain BSH-02190019" /LENGTH=930 /DNA_ID=CAMNT_0019194581 /DNA_START=40 /DNA_END=2829 /DNA_ORIENTATION=-